MRSASTLRNLVFRKCIEHVIYCWHIVYEPVASKTRTYHGQVGTRRRTAGLRGGAGTVRTGRRRVGPPTYDVGTLVRSQERRAASSRR